MPPKLNGHFPSRTYRFRSGLFKAQWHQLCTILVEKISSSLNTLASPDGKALQDKTTEFVQDILINLGPRFWGRDMKRYIYNEMSYYCDWETGDGRAMIHELVNEVVYNEVQLQATGRKKAPLSTTVLGETACRRVRKAKARTLQSTAASAIAEALQNTSINSGPEVQSFPENDLTTSSSCPHTAIPEHHQVHHLAAAGTVPGTPDGDIAVMEKHYISTDDKGLPVDHNGVSYTWVQGGWVDVLERARVLEQGE